MTPSRALRTIGERVDKTLGEPSLFGIKSRTAMAHEACGFGRPATSIRHMRQLPAIDSRSWKQKRGISAPAASQAWSNVYSGGASISLPSTMSLVIGRAFRFEVLRVPVTSPRQQLHQRTWHRKDACQRRRTHRRIEAKTKSEHATDTADHDRPSILPVQQS